MDDLISRQAAIDALERMRNFYSMDDCPNIYAEYKHIIDEINSLPSAQPEIIHCNSCKHWTQSTGKMKGFGLGRCEFHDADLVTCNGFCYWAERREE